MCDINDTKIYYKILTVARNYILRKRKGVYWTIFRRKMTKKPVTEKWILSISEWSLILILSINSSKSKKETTQKFDLLVKDGGHFVEA